MLWIVLPGLSGQCQRGTGGCIRRVTATVQSMRRRLVARKGASAYTRFLRRVYVLPDPDCHSQRSKKASERRGEKSIVCHEAAWSSHRHFAARQLNAVLRCGEQFVLACWATGTWTDSTTVIEVCFKGVEEIGALWEAFDPSYRGCSRYVTTNWSTSELP